MTATILYDWWSWKLMCDSSVVFICTDSMPASEWKRNVDRKQTVFRGNRTTKLLDSTKVHRWKCSASVRDSANLGPPDNDNRVSIESDWLQSAHRLKSGVTFIGEKITTNYQNNYQAACIKKANDLGEHFLSGDLVSNVMDWQFFRSSAASITWLWFLNMLRR